MPGRKFSPRIEAQKIVLKLNIQDAPIDVESIANDIFDIKVLRTDLPDKVSALLSVEDTGSAFIFVNSTHSPKRQSFSIAHELGHFVLHRNTGIHIDKYSYFTRKQGFSDTASDFKEIEANRFAAELLMPAHLVERKITELGILDFLDNDRDDLIALLADEFGVSQMAMSLRLQNLGLTL